MARKPTLVLTLIWHCDLLNGLSLPLLARIGIIRSAPMSIVQLKEAKYQRLKRRIGVGCLTVDQAKTY